MLAGIIWAQAENYVVPAGTTNNFDISLTSGDIIIFPNARQNGSCTTTTGDINVGESSRVDKLISTYSGYVTIGANATTKDVQTESGGIRIEAGATIRGDVTSTNGDIDIDPGATVEGSVESTFGNIVIKGATIEDDVITKDGDIVVNDASNVEGNIEVESRGAGTHAPLYVHIGNCSIVDGDVEAADDDDNVIVDFNCGRVDGALTDVETQGTEWTVGAEAPPGYVVICHKPGTPAEQTMTIPEQALQGHLRHGDTIGPCDGGGGNCVDCN